jgi:hypothetical protein
VNYRPQLRNIEVPLLKLLLDPNNPRFLEDHSTRVDDKDFADGGVQTETAKRMRKEAFRLDELKKSIETNGWQPVDMIFVRHLEALPGHYVVLEGNRRLMALWELKSEGRLKGDIAAEVDPLHVLEVVGTSNVEESRAQITYLLGVRHHGSLKTWGPFAQAHNLYERYLQEGKMADATFRWDEGIAGKIGDRLSVDVKIIEQRLRTYIAMKQLHEDPEIRKIGMKGSYYSLVREVLPPGQAKSPLRKYVVQDPSTFKVDAPSLRRLDAVCHFSVEGREHAPISSPDEWRPLAKILSDDDSEKRVNMLIEVEVEKKAPSDVSARRQAELRQPRWDRWLDEVAKLLKKLQVGNVDREDARTQEVASRLAEILDSLPGDLQSFPAARSAK